MKRGTIAEQWESYRRLLSKNAGPEQVLQTRRAFYAGATALFYLQMADVEPGQAVTDADLDWVAALRRELIDFGKSVGKPTEGERPS